jgi:hypothetical protein
LLALGLSGALAIVASAQSSNGQAHRPRHLTGPSSRDALEIGIDYLRERGPAMGLGRADVDAVRVKDRYVTKRTGTVHLYLRQHIGGIEVEGADVGIAVDARGRLLSVQDRLVRGLGSRALVRRTRIDAYEAIVAAAAHLGIEATGDPVQQRETPGPARSSWHAGAGISLDEIPARLMYVVDSDGSLRLSWNLVIRTPDGAHWWSLHVGVDDGQVLAQTDWIAHDTYRVHPLPQLNPDEGARVLLGNPADSTASPFGWHDTNGSPGAEFTDTRGNNVFAQGDVDADDSGGPRASGGAGLVFDPPLDLDMQPGNYLDASVAQLFYVNNVVHDILYQYGFDEPAGNFQENNYGNGGSQGDPVQADSQDGSDVDNAQFGTPPDGSEPRMEMFRWILTPSPHLDVTSPPAVAGTYLATPALFGAGTPGLSGALVRALDDANGAGPTTTDGCSPFNNEEEVAENLVLIDRGTCTFVTKVSNAQAAGAKGVVIANNAGNSLVTMSGIDPTLSIPAIFIGQSDGASLAAQLGVGVNAEIVSLAARDSSFDAGVVVHEYTHGVTNRLTGGPSNVSCMDAAESAGMGEGFSDWFALVFTAMPGDLSTDARGIAAYLRGQPQNGAGIRNEPYSTDLALSPFTYADVSTLNQPHGVGEVWAASLWEMYWNFVDFYGFDPDLYAGSGGNNRALQLVVDALKLQPCDPTFVEGRDALLTADLNANAGANECLIWNAFGKRGVGLGASDGGSPNSLGVTEDFEVPVECLPEPASGLMLGSGVLLVQALARRRQRQRA